MKTAAALLLAATAPAAWGDLIVFDSQRPDGYYPIRCEFAEGPLDIMLSPEENDALPCKGPFAAGTIRVELFADGPSCSGGEYFIVPYDNSDAIVLNSYTTPVEFCPPNEGITINYTQPRDNAPGEIIGPGALPADAAWGRLGVLEETTGPVDRSLDSPELVGVRVERGGQTYYGWIQFEPEEVGMGWVLPIAWGYESTPGTAAPIIPIESITRTPDYNADGDVDSGDLAELLAKWGTSGPVVIPNSSGGAYVDLDNNGFVGASDLAILLAAWSTP